MPGLQFQIRFDLFPSSHAHAVLAGRQIVLRERLQVKAPGRKPRQAKLPLRVGLRGRVVRGHDDAGGRLACRVGDEASHGAAALERDLLVGLRLDLDPVGRNEIRRPHDDDSRALRRVGNREGAVGSGARLRERPLLAVEGALGRHHEDPGPANRLARFVHDTPGHRPRGREENVEHRGLFRGVEGTREARRRVSCRNDAQGHGNSRLVENDSESSLRVRGGLAEDRGVFSGRQVQERLVVGAVGRPLDLRAGDRLSGSSPGRAR